MNSYFILHGSFGSPFGNWFSWLYNEIEKGKPSEIDENICYVPHFPTGKDNQTYENWEKIMIFYYNTGLLTKDSIIFAHSIAPIFICKFLIKHNIKVKRLVFVCGFNKYFIDDAENYNYVNKTMFCESIEKIKELCDDIVCIYSDNDPYVNMQAEKEFADIVSHKQILVKGGGHLNSESGYNTFEELLNFIG